MRKKTSIAAWFVAVTAGLGAAQAAPIFVIDPFTSDQDVFIGLGSPVSKFATDSTAGNAPFAVGGQRELAIKRDVGTGRMEADVNLSEAGRLSFSENTGVRGSALITWDGPGTTTVTSANYAAGTPDTFGLTGAGTTGGVDLTQANTLDRVKVLAHNDVGGSTLVFTFYTSAAKYATGTVALPVGGYFPNGNPILTPQTLLMSGFTVVGAASPLDIFKDTKAITLRINGNTSGADVTLDYFVTADAAPEPSTISLMAGAALAAGLRLWKGRRRRA